MIIKKHRLRLDWTDFTDYNDYRSTRKIHGKFTVNSRQFMFLFLTRITKN